MHGNAERKAKLERLHLEWFKEACNAFPVGETESTDPPDPDFIVHRGGGAVGIELTRLFHPDDGRRTEQEGLQAQILRVAEAHHDAISPGAPAQFVNVRFAPNFPYTRRLVRNVGAALAKRVLNHLEPQPPSVPPVASCRLMSLVPGPLSFVAAARRGLKSGKSPKETPVAGDGEHHRQLATSD